MLSTSELQYSVDIGSFALGFLLSIIVPLVARRINAKKNKQEEQREQQRKTYEDNQLRHEELKEALSIHESLTTQQVFTALQAASKDSVSSDFLVALHRRSAVRFDNFSDLFPLPEAVVTMIIDALAVIHTVKPLETQASQKLFDDKIVQKQNHEKNPEVQNLIADFASHLAGKALGQGETAKISAQFSDLGESIRVSKSGQGVMITFSDGKTKVWFAGSGNGLVPTVFHHMDSKGCAFHKLKKGLQENSTTGEQLANELALRVRELASQAHVCTCGQLYLDPHKTM